MVITSEQTILTYMQVYFPYVVDTNLDMQPVLLRGRWQVVGTGTYVLAKRHALVKHWKAIFIGHAMQGQTVYIQSYLTINYNPLNVKS